MKKMVTIMLVFVLCMTMLLPAQAATADATITTPDGEGFVSIAAAGETLYLLSATGLYTWQTGDKEPTLLGMMPENDLRQGGNAGFAMATGGGSVYMIGGGMIDHLLIWENTLYGLDSEDGALYSMEAADGKVTLTKALSLQWQAMTENQGGFSFPAMITSIAAADGYLYLLKSGMQASNNELLRFSLTDGGYIKYDASQMVGFSPLRTGKALILQYASEQDAIARTGKLWLNELDLNTGEVAKGIELPVSMAEGFAYDAASDTAAFFSSGEIYAVDQMASCRLAGYAPTVHQGIMFSKAQMLPGSLYALNGEAVSVRSIAKGEGMKRALRIQNAMEMSYKEFAVKRPDIPVVLKDTPFESAELLMQDMAAGSSDLYCLKIDELDYHSLMEKGYTASLSNSEMLLSQVREMYPVLQKELFRGDDLAAFPVTLTGQTLGYSKKALSELGLTENDLPHTFPELMDFITNWDADYGMDHPSLALFRDELFGDAKQMFMGLMIQYYSAHYQKMGQNMTFETPLMEKLLAALETADFSALKTKDVQKAMAGNVTYSISVAGAAEQPATALFTLYQEAVLSEYGFMMNDFVPLPLALDDGLDPIVPASLTVYIVNPYSPNQDLARAYLDHFAVWRSPLSRSAMSPNYNEPIISTLYEVRKAEQEKELGDIKAQLQAASDDKKKELEDSLKRAEEHLAFLESMKWQVSMDDLNAYRERVNWLTVNTINPLTLLAQDQSMAALVGRYTEGQMSLRELLKALEQKLQMIYREGK